MFLTSILKATSISILLSAVPILAQTACNNSPSLCSRPYNNITHLGAHDSPFLRDASTSFSTSGNHNFNSTIQLSSGVRLLTAQVHNFTNSSTGQAEWHLCHSSCSLLDAGTLSSWLTEVKKWMDANPNEVVTILLVNSDGATADQLGAEFTASGIQKYSYIPPTPGSPPRTWPTLQTLISANTRLVTYIASLATPSASHPYLLDEFTHVFENPFENTNPSAYTCSPDRPTAVKGNPSAASNSGRMFLMNHFLYAQQAFGILSPNTTYIQTTNGATGVGSLGSRLTECTRFYGRRPNFVLVDFWNVGPSIASVDQVNGITDAVGRMTVTGSLLDAQQVSGVGGKRTGSLMAVVVALGVALVV